MIEVELERGQVRKEEEEKEKLPKIRSETLSSSTRVSKGREEGWGTQNATSVKLHAPLHNCH